jgi:hypothetical protein
MIARQSQYVLKGPGFVLAIIVVGAQAMVCYISPIDDDCVSMRQFHAGLSLS